MYDGEFKVCNKKTFIQVFIDKSRIKKYTLNYSSAPTETPVYQISNESET